MFVWAIADRALDLIGIFALLLWTVKGTLWVTRRLPRQKAQPRPRAFNLNRDHEI